LRVAGYGEWSFECGTAPKPPAVGKERSHVLGKGVKALDKSGFNSAPAAFVSYKWCHKDLDRCKSTCQVGGELGKVVDECLRVTPSVLSPKKPAAEEDLLAPEKRVGITD
jgi:hypothetical protein